VKRIERFPANGATRRHDLVDGVVPPPNKHNFGAVGTGLGLPSAVLFPVRSRDRGFCAVAAI